MFTSELLVHYYHRFPIYLTWSRLCSKQIGNLDRKLTVLDLKDPEADLKLVEQLTQLVQTLLTKLENAAPLLSREEGKAGMQVETLARYLLIF